MLTVNEDAEILAKLGVLTSNLDSPHKMSQNVKPASGENFQNSATNECYFSTDDEENDSKVIYVKQRLLGDVQHRKPTKCRSTGMTCRNVLLIASFISLGISTAVQGVTLPNMAVSTHANIFSFVVHVLFITALGFLVGCAAVSRLFTRLNPMLLLLFSVTGIVIFTALLGCSRTTSTVYIYSLILGCFHGTVFRGGLIIVFGSNFGTRTLFALHTSFVAGALIISLLSAFFLSGAAVPYLRFEKSSDRPNVLNHLLVKRETDLSLVGPIYYHPLMKNGTSGQWATTPKPLRPDHVVGVESVEEPKSQENVQKRKEVEERKKSKEEGQSGNSRPNGLPEEDAQSRNQSNMTQQNTSSAPQFFNARNQIINITKLTERTVISNSVTSTPPPQTTATIGAATTSSNFTFYDIPYSFSELNQKFGIEASSNWMWKELEQKFGPFENVDMVYALATLLGICCLIPYFIAAACCSSCYVTVANLQIAKLEAAPELSADDREMTIRWRVYSGVFLLLAGAAELIIGESLTLYALCRPELNLSQRNGIFLTSTFWFGICAARIPSIVTAKFISIGRLSNAVLLSAVVAGYIAVNVPSLLAFHCTLFVLGLLLGPLLPSLLCWLDEQEMSSRLSLSLLYGVGISLGRLVMPWFIALLVTINPTPVVLFATASGSLFVSYITLIMTTRTVRAVARLSAVNQFLRADGGESTETSAGVIVEQKKTRNGNYVALVDESDVKCDVFEEEEEEEEEEEDDDFDKDFLLDEEESRKYGI